MFFKNDSLIAIGRDKNKNYYMEIIQ
jgi:hypothetical protein